MDGDTTVEVGRLMSDDNEIKILLSSLVAKVGTIIELLRTRFEMPNAPKEPLIPERKQVSIAPAKPASDWKTKEGRRAIYNDMLLKDCDPNYNMTDKQKTLFAKLKAEFEAR
jgi:hypothetical protein